MASNDSLLIGKKKLISPFGNSTNSWWSHPALFNIEERLVGINFRQYFGIKNFDTYSLVLLQVIKSNTGGLIIRNQLNDRNTGFVEINLTFQLKALKNLSLGIVIGKRNHINRSPTRPADQLIYSLGVAQLFQEYCTIHCQLKSEYSSPRQIQYQFTSGIRILAPAFMLWEISFDVEPNGIVIPKICCEMRKSNGTGFRTGLSSVTWSYFAGIRINVLHVSVDLELSHYPIPGTITNSTLFKHY